MRKTSLNSVYQLAKNNKKVVYIGSDLGAGVLDNMKDDMPERFFMEGVSEQHIIGMAAGIAMEGFILYVNTIATFLTRRCFEQIAVDLCLHDLPVRLIANGGGAVYAPLGPTHLAVEDIAILRSLPNMTIIAPCDADEMQRMMPQTVDWPHPIYIRLAKGGDPIISRDKLGFTIGKGIVMKEPIEAVYITTGVMTQLALKASELLHKKGISSGVIHMPTIRPLDENLLKKYIPKVEAIVVIEEHRRIGGLGSAVLEFCNDEMPEEASKVYRIGFPDAFADQYGNQNSLLEHWGITVENVAKILEEKLKIT